MSYDFTKREDEPEPQAAGSRIGGPPRKLTAAEFLDLPFFPPNNFPWPIQSLARLALDLLMKCRRFRITKIIAAKLSMKLTRIGYPEASRATI